METLLQDIRYGIRQLGNAPGFAMTAILTLALGIGANAAIFTLVHAVLLRNLPVVDPAALVRLGDKSDCCVYGGTMADNDYFIFAYDLYQHLRDTTPEFEQLAAVQAGRNRLNVRGSKSGALPKSTRSEFVTGNYFETFGLRPSAGRLLIPSDDQPNAAPVAVLSYATWERDFGLDPSIVGSTVSVNTHPFTIVGIAPAGFYGETLSESAPGIFLPMAVEPRLDVSPFLHQHEANWVYILGRLKPGVSFDRIHTQLQAKMSGHLREWLATTKTYAPQDQARNLAATHVVLTPGGAGVASMRQQYAGGLHLLMAIAALVLLIACANIANLLLVRGMARAAETSLRMALGAQRRRLLRQMLTESMLLSCLGGIAGLAVAYLGTRLLLSLAFPDAQALPIHAAPSLPVLGFGCMLALVTGFLFGIAPAWITTRSEPAESLRLSNRSTRSSSTVLQHGLVVLQAALSLVLLIGAGLMSKSLNQLEHQDFGLQTANRVVIHVHPEDAGYKPEQLEGLYRAIDDTFSALPAVKRLSLSLYSPLEGNNWGEGIYVEGRPQPGPNDDIGASWLRVSPHFFDLIGQKVVRGRGITDRDTATSLSVAAVNQAFVKKFLRAGEDPIGKRFGSSGLESAGDFTIVGVVNNVKYHNPREAVEPMYFRPLLQVTKREAGSNSDFRSLYIGAIMLELAQPVPGLEEQVRRSLAGINPNLTVVDYRSFESQIAGQLSQDRLIARLTQLFGALSLVLASIGLYGVTSYGVARRSAEIGIRMALGATRASVITMVLRGALAQAGLGLAIGLPIAVACTRLIKAQLYEVPGADLSVLFGSLAVLTLAAAIAGLLPARRAADVDPVNALRAE